MDDISHSQFSDANTTINMYVPGEKNAVNIRIKTNCHIVCKNAHKKVVTNTIVLQKNTVFERPYLKRNQSSAVKQSYANLVMYNSGNCC